MARRVKCGMPGAEGEERCPRCPGPGVEESRRLRGTEGKEKRCLKWGAVGGLVGESVGYAGRILRLDAKVAHHTSKRRLQYATYGRWQIGLTARRPAENRLFSVTKCSKLAFSLLFPWTSYPLEVWTIYTGTLGPRGEEWTSWEKGWYLYFWVPEGVFAKKD